MTELSGGWINMALSPSEVRQIVAARVMRGTEWLDARISWDERMRDWYKAFIVKDGSSNISLANVDGDKGTPLSLVCKHLFGIPFSAEHAQRYFALTDEQAISYGFIPGGPEEIVALNAT